MPCKMYLEVRHRGKEGWYFGIGTVFCFSSLSLMGDFISYIMCKYFDL